MFIWVIQTVDLEPVQLVVMCFKYAWVEYESISSAKSVRTLSVLVLRFWPLDLHTKPKCLMFSHS